MSGVRTLSSTDDSFRLGHALPREMSSAITARPPGRSTHPEGLEAVLRGDRRSQSRGSDRRRLPRCRVDLMGLPVDRLSEEQTVETVLAALRAGRGGCLFTPNLHHVQAFATGADADVYRSPARLEGARVVVADGMPLVWASRLRGTPLPERVAGSDLIFSPDG